MITSRVRQVLLVKILTLCCLFLTKVGCYAQQIEASAIVAPALAALQNDTTTINTSALAVLQNDTTAINSSALAALQNDTIASALAALQNDIQNDTTALRTKATVQKETTARLTDSIPSAINQIDSIATNALDSVQNTAANDSTAKKRADVLDAKVEYQAKDSIVFLADGTGFLYGDGKVDYQLSTPITLTAENIRFKLDSSTVYAVHGVDSLGNKFGNPVFSQGDDSYESHYMSYNFKTKKAYVKGVVTQQDEGYIWANETKMFQGDSTHFYIRKARYTTCDEHEHPHFYMHITKGKMVPGKYLASGPAYLVFCDVPVPIAVPFAYFPITSKYASGIIMPQFGEDISRGLFLKNGGYYWAINDYVDLEVLGEIYTKGTWAISAASKYAWRYKFKGSVSLTYREDVTGTKNTPDYRKSTNFKIAWTHTQDPKASKYSTFSASVNYSTSGYNTSNINNYYNTAALSTNVTSSSINYTQKFPDSQWSISVNASLTQRTSDSTISLTLPSLTVNLGQTYPFKRKNPVGKERWYEKIRLSYTMTMSNSINTKESEFLHSKFLRDWKNGIKHSLPISASYTLFKYLNFSITQNFNDRMYFSKINRDWDMEAQKEVQDTTYGFYNVYDFSTSVSLSTKIYGFYIPSRKLFGDYLDRFRHVITPSVSFTYHPDFGSDLFKFYDTYTKTIIDKNSSRPISIQDVTYSPYSNGLYGVPGRGTSSTLNFSIQNNIEAKVKDKSDSTGVAYKKVSIIDNLAVSWGYNFAADSLNWNNLNLSIRLKLTKKFTLNLNGAFDPYRYIKLESGNIVRSNQLRWNYGQGLWFKGTSTSFSYTFNNDTFKKKKDRKKTDDTTAAEDDPLNINAGEEVDPITGMPIRKEKEHEEEDNNSDRDTNGYKKPKIPWSLTLSYTMGLAEKHTPDFYSEKHKAYKLQFTHNLTFNGNIKPTDKWTISASGSFNLTELKITQTSLSVTRDLHCWTLSAQISPFGVYKSFMVTVGVNASMLKDVKYEKTSQSSTNMNWLVSERTTANKNKKLNK